MTSDADPGPQLRGRLSYQLKHAFFDLEELHRERLEPFGINGREFGVLVLLASREPESQQQAAARLDVDRTTMVALLDGLEAKGLVARRPDGADRRRNVVTVTDEGRRILRKATRASDEAERQLLADLDDTEQSQLRALLARIGTAKHRRQPATDGGVTARQGRSQGGA